MIEVQQVVDKMYGDDTASQELGITITDAGVGRAVAAMTVTPAMTNGHNVCHGGLIFALADTAMAFASNSHNVEALAAGAAIDFVNPAMEGAVLSAEAIELSKRGRSGIYDVVVTDGDGETIAMFRGRTRQVGRPIVEEGT